MEDMLEVLHRLFPFSRGLYEDKVANVWCTVSVMVKLRQWMTLPSLMSMATVSTLVASLPSCVHLLFNPTPYCFLLSLVSCVCRCVCVCVHACVCVWTIFAYFYDTVYVQIFKACKFRGCHKSSIFAIFFWGSRSLIYASQSSPMKFQGWKFCRWPVHRKNLESYIPRKFVRIW